MKKKSDLPATIDPAATTVSLIENWYSFGLLRAPGMVRLALEWRAPWEFGAGILAHSWLATAAGGDGHPVIVYPGLLASDLSTLLMRRFLDGRSYVTYGWEQGSNLGLRAGVLDTCRKQLRKVRKRHRRRVSLIGWSLGGLFARELAKEFPEDVRLVITLGTPFTGHPKATNAWRIYELVTGHRIGAPELHEPLRVAPPVPTTSIFSRTDGIVAWECCVQPCTRAAESIEVQSSHFGLGTIPTSLYAIADRLAQPEGEWRPFDRSGTRALFYSDPQRGTWS